MPRKAKELSPIEVKRLTNPGLHAVGGVSGLYLQVLPTGARTWVLRVTIGKRRRDMGLGGFPDVTLAQAREKAREARDKIERGIDPIAERQSFRSALAAAQAAAITFDQAAEKFIAVKAPEWHNRKHRQQWENTLAQYASPVIGKMHVKDIEMKHVVQVLEPIWTTRTETAARLRGRIEQILDWATVREHREGENPARWRGKLDKLLPMPGKVAKKSNFAALPWGEMGVFMADLRKQAGIAARAVEFAILTAARSGEVRNMEWSEVDLETGVWIVPASRMKARKEHRVPLSARAVALLREMPMSGDLAFPGRTVNAPLSDMSLTAVLRRMGRGDITVHGFRSAFRDWASEVTAYPHEMAEMALAHTIDSKVERAYRRGDLFEKRRRMMQDWAKYCDTVRSAGREVVAINSKAEAA